MSSIAAQAREIPSTLSTMIRVVLAPHLPIAGEMGEEQRPFRRVDRGAQERSMAAPRLAERHRPADAAEAVNAVAGACEKLPPFDDAEAFEALFDRYGDAKV